MRVIVTFEVDPPKHGDNRPLSSWVRVQRIFSTLSIPDGIKIVSVDEVGSK